MTYPDAQAQSDFLLTGFNGWPASLFVRGETQDHGEIAVTIIASRAGTELPLGPRLGEAN